jgi:hypothetical protein
MPMPKVLTKAITGTVLTNRSLPRVNPHHGPALKMIRFFFPAKPVRLAAPARLGKSLLRVIPRASAAIHALVSSDRIAVAVAIAVDGTAVVVIAARTAAVEVIVAEAIVVEVAEVIVAVIAVAAPVVAQVDDSNGVPEEARVTTVVAISVPAPRAVRN